MNLTAGEQCIATTETSVPQREFTRTQSALPLRLPECCSVLAVNGETRRCDSSVVICSVQPGPAHGIGDRGGCREIVYEE